METDKINNWQIPNKKKTNVMWKTNVWIGRTLKNLNTKQKKIFFLFISHNVIHQTLPSIFF